MAFANSKFFSRKQTLLDFSNEVVWKHLLRLCSNIDIEIFAHRQSKEGLLHPNRQEILPRASQELYLVKDKKLFWELVKNVKLLERPLKLYLISSTSNEHLK